MKVSYSDKPIEWDYGVRSIFLIGPTPRDVGVKSWRPEAIEILKTLNFNGQVLVPERGRCELKLTQEQFDKLYLDQVEWENEGTEGCTRLVVWVPRELKTMPAFTTNVEFGRYVESGKMFYGRPDESPKNRYLDWLYRKFNTQPIYNNLRDLLKATIETL